jgi:hypothetical protein
MKGVSILLSSLSAVSQRFFHRLADDVEVVAAANEE